MRRIERSYRLIETALALPATAQAALQESLMPD